VDPTITSAIVEEYFRKKGMADCVRFRRNASKFTHHKKIVVCDNGVGKMVGFVGGLDLAVGRYDHSGHPLVPLLEHTFLQVDLLTEHLFSIQVFSVNFFSCRIGTAQRV